MRPHQHYDDLSAEQRFYRIATLLAIGLRRLHPRKPYSVDSYPQAAAKNLPKLSPNCLDLSAETRLSGQAG